MLKTLIYTSLALLAFAGNSILCRLALGQQLIGPVAFTSLRLFSGALFLALLLLWHSQPRNPNQPKQHRLVPALALWVYALAFSFAYLSLDTGTGALILFAAVQITMVVAGWLKGQRLLGFEWLGLLLAFAGMVYLVLPTLGTPSLLGFCLMAVAGIAWGLYSISGQGVSQPVRETALNFVYAAPAALLLVVFMWPPAWTVDGLWLAVLSGVLTSGLGYVIWYAALPRLKTTQAAVVQLLVPVLAAAGGLWLVGEAITWRLVQASVVILGGIALVFWARFHHARRP